MVIVKTLSRKDSKASASDSLSVSKKSIRNLFDKLLREKRGFKYITLKKRINDNDFEPETLHLNSSAKR